MVNFQKKTRVCVRCKEEKPLSEFYKRQQWRKKMIKPKLLYYKQCKICFGKHSRDPWKAVNPELRNLYKKNSYHRKRGEFDKIDTSKYKGRLCERPDRIEKHLKRQKNKKLIKGFQANVRNLRNEKKKKIDDGYQQSVDILSPMDDLQIKNSVV